MSDLAKEIAESAAEAAEFGEPLGFGSLDYSEPSLEVVDKILDEATDYDLPADRIDGLVEAFGCYILEVGRRQFGGVYQWHDDRDQPVLVVGEPNFRAAMITWDRVRERLTGDESNNIPFFYAGFAGCVRKADPRSDALYV